MKQSAASQLALERRNAALLRWVRWGASAFTLGQFCIYSASADASAAPWASLLTAGILAIAASLAAANLAAMVLEHRAPRGERPPGRPARRDLALVAVDTALVIAVIELFAFDAVSSLWALLVIPLLEAAVVGRMRIALAVWSVCVVALVVLEVLSPDSFNVVSLTYRCGVLLLVATIVGAQASLMQRYVEALHETRRALLHEAQHDHLTGLAGRGLFLDSARRALQRGHVGELGAAVLYVDCDRFKQINDTLGHAAGDAVLVEVGRRLRTSVRPGDTVARLGGDEFAVLLDGISAEEAHRIAGRMRVVLADPYDLPGSEEAVPMSCSVGLALPEAGSTNLETLLRRADTEMYRVKRKRSEGSPARV